MTSALIAKTLAVVDVGVLAAFGVQALRLRRKRRRLGRLSPGERHSYQLLAVVAAGAVLSLLIGGSTADHLPF